MTAAHEAPLSMGFPRQEYWSGLPLPSAEDLPHPGIDPESLVLPVDSLPSEAPGSPGESLEWRPKPRFPGGSAGKESACNARIFLGWEDPLEKGMAIHSGILVWRIPWNV